MEIEEVAAHNADVYNAGRPSAQKRKREKAQDQLRNRMRKRNNGPSSTVVSARLRDSQRDRDESTHLLGVKSVATVDKRNSTDEWSGQEVRDEPSAGRRGRVAGERRRRHGEVPLTELVDRVIHRRSQSKSSASPMTIRALKPPAPPYGIQHPALIRKIQPVSKRKPASGGPYVVVLNRNPTEQPSESASRPNELPPLKPHEGAHQSGRASSGDDAEMATWRPELSTSHRPYVHPNAEDRSVTNYRLQMQQAVRTAELRGDFSTSVKPLHRTAPLPAIQVAYEVVDPQHHSVEGDPSSVDESSSLEGGSTLEKEHATQEEEGSQTDPRSDRKGRFTSSQEVLRQMQARKQAKRKRRARGGGGGSGAGDFDNPLRTRSRFTTKMKLFKEGLQKVRELSIIQEDQSSISDRLSRLSAGRTSAASYRSVSSLKRIEESVAPRHHSPPRTDRPPEPDKVSSSESDDELTETNHSRGSDEGVLPPPQESPPNEGDSRVMAPSVDPDLNSSASTTSIDFETNLENPPTGQMDEGSISTSVIMDSSTVDPEPEPGSSDPDEHSGSSYDNATDIAPAPSPQIKDEGSSSASRSQSTSSLVETGGEAAEAAAEVKSDATALRDAKLAVKPNSYEETDSDRGFAADTSHIKDIILSAETVQ